MPAKWSIQTARTPGAVAIFQLTADSPAELDAVLARLGIAPVTTGSIGLRNLCGIDRGLVAHWSPQSVHLMPHGGTAVIRKMAAALTPRALPSSTSCRRPRPIPKPAHPSKPACLLRSRTPPAPSP